MTIATDNGRRPPADAEPTTAEVLGAVSRPLPADRRSLSRRAFLQAAAVAGGVAALPTWMADAAEAALPLGAGDGVLVLITMGGGNDGLNTVIPVADGTYHDRRRDLAFTPSEAIALTGDRALHPNLPMVKSLWDRGDVAVIEGVGVPGTDLSHFSSMARWMAGTEATTGFRSGWLGRYIDGLAGGDDPFHAVSIGTSIPLVVQGDHRLASGLPSSAGGMIELSTADPYRRRQYEALASFGDTPTGRGELADLLAGSGRRALDLAARIEPVYVETQPENELTRELDLCARLINADLGIRVLSVIYGDFDSHSDQPTMHGARMAELDEALRAFFAKLHPAFGARTLVLTASEFGRRVKANNSSGTDHGAASTLLAIGPQVRGGFYGQMPSLTSLTREGNLVPTVDFRSVYATVLDTWLGADSGEILGSAHENLGFVAAPAPSRTTPSTSPTVSSPIFTIRGQIVRLYQACLGRLPDSAGLDHWVAARRAGLALLAVADGFVASSEFVANYGALNDQQFVERAYANVLGRAPDAGGLAHWLSVLARGSSRGQVMTGLSESAEFKTAMADRERLVDRSGPVARLYRAYFLRDPDDDGLRYWIGADLGYAAVSDAFAASDEFSARYGALDDDRFVELVYQNVLGRSPDAEGRRYWLSQLAGGTSRGRVMLGFSESAEFVARTGTL